MAHQRTGGGGGAKGGGGAGHRGGAGQGSHSGGGPRTQGISPQPAGRTVLQNRMGDVMLGVLALACILFALWIRRRATRKAVDRATTQRTASEPQAQPHTPAPATATAKVRPASTQAPATSRASGAPTASEIAAKARYVHPVDPTLRMPNVAIVGGGLSGLSCALSLQRCGIPVGVYERDDSMAARKQGFGLTLTNNPVGPLAELGVLDRCITEDCVSTAHWVLTPEGEIRGYYGRGLHDTDAAAPAERDSASLRIPREDLRRMLLDRLEPGTVRWGYKLRDYSEDLSAKGDPVTLQFEDGRTATADLLVGADGIFSVVRRLRDGKEGDGTGLRYLSVCVILGISSAMHSLLDARGIYIVSGSARLFTMPFRPASVDESGNPVPPQTMWQLSFAYEDEAEARVLKNSTSAQLLAFALKRTSGWIDPVASLILATPASEVWSTPLYDRDPMRLRSKERASLVTVAGDAAHPMSMFKGQGANQALQDGPALAAWVRHQHAKRRDTSASLALGMTRSALLTRVRQYESEVVSRSTPRVLDSRQAAAWYHSPAACEIAGHYGLGNVALQPGTGDVAGVLHELASRGVGAHLGAALEARVREVITELNARSADPNASPPTPASASSSSASSSATSSMAPVVRRRQVAKAM